MNRQHLSSPHVRTFEFPVQDALVILCLLALHGAFFVPALLSAGEALLGRNPLFFVRVMVAGITCALVAKAGIRRVLRQALFSRLLLGLLGFALLSVIWSIDRAETLSAALALGFASLLGAYISAQYDMHAQIQLYTIAALTMVILSVLAAVLLPQYGVMSQPAHLGRWNGILGHKNTLGYITALSIIILLYFPPEKRSLLFLPVSILALIFAEAAAATVIAGVAFLLWPVYFVWKNRPQYRKVLLWSIAFAAGCAIVLGFLTMNADSMFRLLGRSSTLTGRTHLWDAALTVIAERPILGYGYLASFSPASPIHQYLVWKEAPHAHNILLDTLLDLGTIGTVLFVAHYARTLWRAFRLWMQARIWGFAVVFLIFFVLAGLADGNGLMIRNMYWVMYVAVSLTIAQATAR